MNFIVSKGHSLDDVLSQHQEFNSQSEQRPVLKSRDSQSDFSSTQVKQNQKQVSMTDKENQNQNLYEAQSMHQKTEHSKDSSKIKSMLDDFDEPE